VEYRKAEITGLEEQVLLVPEMHFSERADIAFGADHDGAVVEIRPGSFGNPRDNMHAVPRRALRPSFNRRPARNLLGKAECLLTRGEHVTGIGQFREYDEVGALRRGPIYQLQAVRDIGGDVAENRLHLNTGDLDRSGRW
jgi:hypothetical protein